MTLSQDKRKLLRQIDPAFPQKSIEILFDFSRIPLIKIDVSDPFVGLKKKRESGNIFLFQKYRFIR